MAYSPGQPWDATLSYTSGQTCTYNGLPYVFWREEPHASTVGVPPNEEMAPFPAVDAFGATSYRSERAWVLGDRYQGESYLDFNACYGDVRKLQPTIRGNDAPAVDLSLEYLNAALTGIFPTPTYDKRHPSWAFYRQGMGQSVDYDDGGIGNVILDEGENPRRVIYAPAGTGPIPALAIVAVNHPTPTTTSIDVIFRVGSASQGTELQGYYACFGKTGNFSVLDGNSPPGVIATGSANVGLPRDNFFDPATYVATTVNLGTASYWSLRLDSITPSFGS